MTSDITADMVQVELEDGTSIEYSRALLEEVRQLAVSGFTAFGRGGLEIGGVLYGLREGARLTIHAFGECPCQHALGPAFVLTGADRQLLAQLVRGPAGLDTLGWYRTHTRRGLELDASDRELFAEFPPGMKTVGLVLKPARWGASSGAFYVRDSGGKILPQSAREFTVEPPAQSIQESQKSSFEPNAPAEPDDAVIPPAFVPQRAVSPMSPPRRHWPAAAVGAAAAILAVAALGWHYYFSLPPANLALEAYAIATGQVRISWNHGSRPALEGTSGVVEIRDGDADTRIPLDAAALRQSSLTYTQKTDQIEVDLRVNRGAGDPLAEESIEFMGPAETAEAQARARMAEIPPPDPISHVKVERDSRAAAPAAEPLMKRATDTQPAEPAEPSRPKFEIRNQPSTPALVTPVDLSTPPPAISAPVLQAKLPDLFSQTPTIAKPAPPPAPAKPALPRSGRLIWTGRLDRHGLLEINGGHASSGSLAGSLLGIPADFRIEPAEFTRDGLMVYTTDGAANGRTEAPSQSNGWNAVEFAFDPVRVGTLKVLEAPDRANNFKRLVVLGESKSCPVIVVDWKAR